MKRKQLNIRIPQSHLDRINELRGDLTQSEFIMRLADEEWARRNDMSNSPDEPKTILSTEFVIEKIEKAFVVGVAAGHGARSVAIKATNGDLGRVAFYRDYYSGEYQEGFGSLNAARGFFETAKSGQKMSYEEVLGVLEPETEDSWLEAVAAS